MRLGASNSCWSSTGLYISDSHALNSEIPKSRSRPIFRSRPAYVPAFHPMWLPPSVDALNPASTVSFRYGLGSTHGPRNLYRCFRLEFRMVKRHVRAYFLYCTCSGILRPFGPHVDFGAESDSCRRKIRWPFRQKDHRIALVVVTEIVYLTVPAALVARAEAGACSKPLRIQVYSMEFSSISVVRPTPADLYQL